MGIELAKFTYQVGEGISVKPYIISMGKRPITVFSGSPLFRAKVYDADGRVILFVPTWSSFDILAHYTLKSQIPYYVEEGWIDAFAFTLEEPGRYNIVAWADFTFDKDFARYLLRAYADPIWIEVVTTERR